VFYWVVKYTLGMSLKVVFRPWARGWRNMPRRGPVILASNHLSFADHFFGPLPLPRKVVFLAKAEYFTGRGLKGLLKKAFFAGVGQIPIDRTGGEASELALRSGLRVLADGKVLGIYPEGTRSPDGRLYKGRTGVARLALESRAPVVPCAMIHTFEFLPSGSFRPQWRIRPGVIFGSPLDFSRYYGQESDRAVLRTVTDEIIAEIGKLSGQEYVDIYAKQAKDQLQADSVDPDLPQALASYLLLFRRPIQDPARRIGLPHASGSPYRRRRLPRAERCHQSRCTQGSPGVRPGVRGVPRRLARSS
jgi:1-acyl-sn-glycerol-3-phosphate acyltransferase